VKASTRTTIQIEPLYLARGEAAAFLSISEAQLERLVAAGDMPKPRKLSAGRTAWLVDELRDWGRSRPVSDLLPPVNAGQRNRARPCLTSSSPPPVDGQPPARP
jgi:prophage regulatory protein